MGSPTAVEVRITSPQSWLDNSATQGHPPQQADLARFQPVNGFTIASKRRRYLPSIVDPGLYVSVVPLWVIHNPTEHTGLHGFGLFDYAADLGLYIAVV